MQKSITDGDKVLESFGVSFEELKTKTPETQFKALLTQLNAIEDPAEKTRFAMAAFKDISLVNMASEFEDATAEAKNLGVIMNDGAIKAAQDFNDKLDTMKMQLQAAFVNAIPFVEEWGAKTFAVGQYVWTMFFEEGKQMFENLFTNIALIPTNFGIVFDWLTNNWTNVWNNLGTIFIDVVKFMGNTIGDIFMAQINGIADHFKLLWEGIKTGDFGKILDAVNPVDIIADEIVAVENNWTKLQENIAKDTGIKMPQMLGVAIDDGMAQIKEDATNKLAAAWANAEKTKGERDAFKFEGGKVGESAKVADASKKNNAELAIKGSQEAYKQMLAFRNQDGGNLEKKQLEEAKETNKLLNQINEKFSAGTPLAAYSMA